jgi:hypothetical protein
VVLNGHTGKTGGEISHDSIIALYLNNTHKDLSENGLSPGQELKRAPPEYDARLLTFMDYLPDPSELI